MDTITEMTARQQRAASLTEALRRLAPHEDAALPHTVGAQVSVYTHSPEQFAATVRALGRGRKKFDPDDGLQFVADLGEGLLPAVVEDLSGKVCERVQVGVETVTETIPDPDAPMVTVTREQPVFETRCPPSILALAAAESTAVPA